MIRILPRGMGKRSILGRGNTDAKIQSRRADTKMQGPISGLGWFAYGVPASRKLTENEARHRQVPDWKEQWLLFQSLNLVLWAIGFQTWLCRFLSPIHYQSESVWGGVKESVFSPRSAYNAQPWLGPTAVNIARTFSKGEALSSLDCGQAQEQSKWGTYGAECKEDFTLSTCIILRVVSLSFVPLAPHSLPPSPSSDTATMERLGDGEGIYPKKSQRSLRNNSPDEK